jgi:hypothetical protein
MKVISCLILSLCLIPFCSLAQTQTDTTHYWKKTGLTEINFNQASLTNWQGGGQNTIAGAGFIHLSASYKKGIHQWDNRFDAAYGLVRLGDKRQPFQKSDDELKISTIYGRAISKNWNLVATGDFKTTFAPGYKYGKDSVGNPIRQEKLSQFMSPGYLSAGLGIEYKPSDVFLAIFSPLATRITFIANDSMAAAGMYGVPAGQHIRVEAGEALKLRLHLPIMKNILLESNLDLFGNYKHLQYQVVDWTNDLTFKVNSVFTAKAGTHLIYDHDIIITKDDGTKGPAVQFKEVIAIGIQYKLL